MGLDEARLDNMRSNTGAWRHKAVETGVVRSEGCPVTHQCLSVC